MHAILEKTLAARNRELEALESILNTECDKKKHVRKMKATEMRLVRNIGAILAPEVMYSAEELIME